MSTDRIVEYIDIEAPREEVFAIIEDLEKRLQLSPLWGFAEITQLPEVFPAEGASYHVKVVKGDDSEYDTVITAFRPPSKLAYRLTVDMGTEVTWTVQEIANGTRITYEEEYATEGLEKSEVKEFSKSVRKVVKNWLRNIKNYAELRESRLKRLIRWLLDRYFLRMNKEQRNVVVTVLFLQVVGMISFIMAALALGIAGLVT